MQIEKNLDSVQTESAHLRDYWRIVWDSRWVVLAVFVTVFGITAVSTFLSTAIYRAVATVEIQARSRPIAPVANVANLGVSNTYSWFSEERYFNTQFEVIKSRAVVDLVFERLGLENHPQFSASADPVMAFISLIRVEPVGDTGIVKISIEGPNPEEIARWVNAVAETYVSRNLELAIQDTRDAIDALMHEMEPLRAQLIKTQDAQFDFAKQSRFFVPEDDESPVNERLMQLEREQTEARVRRLELEAVFNKIEELSRTGESYLVIPQVAMDPTIRRMTEDYSRLEKELSRLLVSYKSNHPVVIEKRSEVNDLRKQIEEKSRGIIEAIRTEYGLNRNREESLKAEIQRTKEESLRTKETASSYAMLASDTGETRRIFDLLKSRVKEISLNTELLSNNIRILDEAIVPSIPVRPRTRLNLIIGIVLGIGLGVGIAYFLDYLDNTIKSSEEIENVLGLSTLAVVPRYSGETQNATREAYQTFRTSILFTSRSRSDRLILITSAGPREGKTTATVELARTIAAAGESVCIVDADLRRPMVHAQLKVRRHHGLTNYLMCNDEASWKSYVKQSGASSVSVMTCGAIPPNPPQLFGSDRFARLLQTLKEKFDWVLVDSPPVSSLTDSIIIASVVDLVVLVVRYQQTDRDIIKRAVGNLRNVSTNLVGVVLNDVDPERSHYKSYYDYSYYLESDKTTASRDDEEEIVEPEDHPARTV